MDDWSDFREPTEDERSARRVLALALTLENARRPLTTTEIRHDLYPNLSDQTFRKTFARDRERLVLTGLVTRRVGPAGMEASWEMDEDLSFVRNNPLSPQDALLLDLLLLPVASDPTFPYARDLHHALTKIDRSFDGSSTAALPPEARQRNNHLSRIEDCMTAAHALRLSYTRADGTSLERIVAPYGLFCLREETYLVAARVGENGTVDERESPHTYNLSRVTAVRPLPRIRFALPGDFDVRDFIRLPFQLGKTLYRATFVDPTSGDEHVEDVADEGVAAAWAIAQGLRPASPPSLIDEWQARLRRAAGGEGGTA